MTSKKLGTNENDPPETEAQEQHPQTEDWRPDYFPTSAKPVFKKIGILTISILILCLFLGYCSTEETKTEQKTQEQQALPQNEEESENEIFD